MRPALFSSLPFAEAVKLARTQQRLLLIDFTAEWCAPCKNMDQTTWVDPRVVEWVERQAIAVQVDVDAEEAVASRFEVRAMPTVVVLRDEMVLDRSTGARPAAALLEWLEGVLAGRTELQSLQEELDPNDPSERLHLARKLLQENQLAEAETHLEAAWLHGHHWRPEWIGVRMSYLVGAIHGLVARSPHARETFTAIRDQWTHRLTTPEAVRDWLALNTLLGHRQRSLDWFDTVKASPPEWLLKEHALFDLLVEAERWADLGRFVRAPLVELEHERSIAKHMEETARTMPDAGDLAEFGRERVRECAKTLIKALRAAGRDEDVKAVRDDARLHDPSDAMRVATEEVTVPSAVLEFHDQSGKREVPLKEQNVIGRDDDCSVAVKSPTMSRRHGELTFENGRWMLSDLGSASGTWVDGKQIKPSCELHDGQTFRMVNVDFVLRLT